jgi:4'-phosphopantetheinyl transferase
MSGSMSYAADRIAFAFAREPVGIDVELVRPDYEWRSAARRVLPPTVRASIAGLPAHQQTCAFFRAWAEREALAKAVGLGIIVGPGELDDAAAATAEAWTVTPLAAGPCHVASVVTAGAAGQVHERGWVPVAQLLA